ncbi:Uu.00g096450.m01.CDS01 [Anthostomella pinea]|uniref:Uu.00g096450.m01.CDS01 n=1 Tax=Anthostomella pinea TaxID=933095 RepID=A0AAI8VCA8_9PEZI|nr:Uu.00g096450.m01.CDS01 [Anthostomella pinea]
MKLSDVSEDWYLGSPMRSTIRYMLETGYEQWGFLIYRCTYGDDDAWDSYMAYLREEVHSDLDHSGCDVLLEQYARWTVVEDESLLDGASKDQVRRRFVAWRDRHSDSVFQWPPPRARQPRFAYCLYVDQKCLDTLHPHVEAKSAANRRDRPPPPLVAAVIDGDFHEGRFDSHAREGETYPPVEGCAKKYVGWQYYSARCLAGLYENLQIEHMDGYFSYQRPPAIGPWCSRSMDDLV